jgi:hypothetical protein
MSNTVAILQAILQIACRGSGEIINFSRKTMVEYNLKLPSQFLPLRRRVPHVQILNSPGIVSAFDRL